MGFYIWAAVLLLFGTVFFTYTFRKAPGTTIGIFILLWCSPILTLAISIYLGYIIVSLAPSHLLKWLYSLKSKINPAKLRHRAAPSAGAGVPAQAGTL